ncbi:ABC-type phosphate transport system, ATPase component [Thermococcus kodakarensis KOD1]|uniref:Phosphate import ATP-binding protein PstB n=1 Tax=Thermococcus kodakarensis (strain ATCC BAA-918 / JCM 12380 / KOD1) TaxID=69014 RepID=PSTB_THEKO|nr:phosphate ABC transporter ATP-binding protein [Thermococcus kodakarensis]Q5JEP9.1 RecName: Full=Phosphate import ATP-binding protein PstB; AltName: Full=ABC phosphate transporter; AltName: Full=Phosphate-transporting ATPase [Thermococcus kodakarensis KOD1]WCN27771.1 phosphate ABC transporter ATP-binding protein [Thermococcus kodakarensis]WCN30065.1 phosphate ABC transporter ATP-binding protein [Thermococcus kodakarensis]BAD86057.1 ABC-type phosphate transport system, ATPase component [Thermo
MNFAIETVNLNVYYGQNHVIKDVDLKIPNKGVFALMGPSGCGKSTMLRTFNRLIELNEDARVEGEVRLFGENIYSEDVDPIEVRKKVGMVFQYPNPFPHLTIYDNVAIGLKLNGLVKSREELDERVEWALKKAALWDEVKDRLNDYPGNLSGGQRQRLVIARALAMKPEVLLMDEPTANIDPVGTAKIEELLLELKEDYTIVLVTHSPAQAARVADYVAFLYLGELIEVGPARKVFENPEHELTEKYVTGALG